MEVQDGSTFCTNFDLICIKYGLKFFRNVDVEEFKKHIWTKRQIEIDRGNEKAIESVISILPNDILSHIYNYKDVKELYKSINFLPKKIQK